MHRNSPIVASLAALVAIGCVAVAASAQPPEPDPLDALLSEVAAFDYGKDPACLTKTSDLIVASQGDPARRQDIAVRLGRLLSEESTTLAAKQYVCRQLWRIGSKEVVPYVAPLLLDEATADMARYALERMPAPEAGAALREALGKASGPVKIGLINSLGERRDNEVIDAMFALVDDADLAVAQAAIDALVKIGGTTVAQTAATRGAAGRPELDAAWQALLLEAARQFASSGQDQAAKDLSVALLETSALPQVRAAALKGMVAVCGAQALPFVLEALKSDEGLLRTAAADAMREIPGAEATQAFVAALPTMPPNVQVPMLHALADRHDAAARSAVKALPVENEDPAVRMASIEVMAKLGDATAVLPLAQVAAGDDKDMAKAARRSLSRLQGGDIDTAIVQALQEGETKVRVELIRALAARYARDAVPPLLKTAADPDERVREETFEALDTLASEEHLPALIDLLVRETAAGPQRKAERAVVATAKRIPDPARRARAALAAFPGTQRNIPGRCALVRVLAKLGDDSTLEPLRGDLASPEPQLQEAAIRALAEWPTPAPLPDLYAIAESGPSDVLRALALRAYFRLLELPDDRTAADTVALYAKGLNLATGVDEKKMALGGLADVPHQSAVELIQQYANDPDLADEAAMALEKIENRGYVLTASHNAGETAKANDGDIATRWTTGTPQVPGQWFQIDLGWEETVACVILDAAGSARDYPRGYEVYVATSTEDWGEPVAQGQGEEALLEVACTPKLGRYVRIVQTGSVAGLYWSIHEFKIETTRPGAI